MGKKRELGFLNKVFSEYKGQYDGWWSDENLAKCDLSSGKPKENGTPIEGKWVCLENLGILEGKPKNGNEQGGDKEKEYEWTIYNQGNGKTTNSGDTYKHYSDGSKLFKFWEDKKDWFKKSSKNGTSTGLPDLQSMVDYYENYWTVSSRDYDLYWKIFFF